MMEPPAATESSLPCPTCGGPTEAWPNPDGSGHLTVCPTCSSETPAEVDKPNALQEPTPEKSVDPATRFRELIAQSQDAPMEGAWPESLLEDLPEEARNRLTKPTPPTPSKKTEEFGQDLETSLRDRGYFIEQDAHGARIRGDPDSEALSPYDVVRLVADLEGGVVPIDKRRHCPKCDAVVPLEETRCQWCSEPIPPDLETPNDN
jgi:hypothetical protein